MVPRWQIFGDFLGPAFPASLVQHISDLHSKYVLGHTMCESMVDIQSVAAEIRRGIKKKEEEESKKETTGQKYNVRICYAGRPQNVLSNF